MATAKERRLGTSNIITNRVKELREAKPWTRPELARKAEIAEQTLMRMEVGLPTMKNKRLRVAKALGVAYKTIFPKNED